jgi:magnesium transporter
VNPTAALLEPEVRELIQEGRYSELRSILHELPFADVAEIFAELEPSQAAVGFRFLQRDDAGEVFAYLASEKQEQLIQELGAEGAVRIVEAMSADDRAALLDELPAEVAQRLIASLSPTERKVTQAILGYPAKSVGRLMSPDYIRLRPEWTIAKSMEHIRRFGKDAETINVVYVIDKLGKLIDDIKLRRLLLADPDQTVESLMSGQYIALKADDPQEEAVRQMHRYDRIALPVVDSRGILVGIVTVDDVADVAEEEVTEDIHKLGGMQALESSYMQAGQFEMFRKRGSWLSALFVGQTITIVVLGSFQGRLAQAVVLTLFLPLVISCGGNSGSQAATLITRALALSEVGLADWARIIRRELVTAAALGAALSILGFLCVLFFATIGHARTEHPFMLAGTVAGAIVGVVLWGTTLGSLLPLLLKRLGVDPATASSPMVATLMDASGTLIYLGIAVLVLTGTVL